MRRFATAALLAAPLLLLGMGVASANPGPCTFGFGCGGFCFKLWPRIHQHGPLYNYGPYYGYPPFEPYGYWNAYLQYTGPVGPQGGGGGKNWHGKWGQGNPNALCPGGLFGRNGCGGFGKHLHSGLLDGSLLRGGLGGCKSCDSGHGLRRGHDGCKSCSAAAQHDATAGSAFDRYSGYGEPESSAAYYVGTPSVSSPNPVIPVGFIGR
jgi:hypothetical protein